MSDIQRARTALFLTRLLLVLVLLVLVLAASGAKAVPPPFPCQWTNPNGLPLTAYDITGGAKNILKCVYGPPALFPCDAMSVDGRALVRAVLTATGRVRCVYQFEVTW